MFKKEVDIYHFKLTITPLISLYFCDGHRDFLFSMFFDYWQINKLTKMISHKYLRWIDL